MSTWITILEQHTSRADVLLREGNSEAATIEIANAAELLYNEAVKADNVKTKAKLANRASEFVVMLTQLHGNKTVGGVGAKTAHVTDSRDRRQNKPQKNDDDEDTPPKFQPRDSTLTFGDIAGLEEIKRKCLIAVKKIQHRKLAEHFGLKTGGVMLFFGPPGTGKTMLARAVASELGLPFYIVKCSELLSKYYGESTKNLAAVFEQARAEEKGAVVFFDEIDNLARKRTSSTHGASLKILTQLLTELDGADSNNAKLVFLAATNFPWQLDDAFMSRIKEKCYVPLPDAPARRVIIEKSLSKGLQADDVDIDDLTTRTNGLGGREISELCQQAMSFPFEHFIDFCESRGLNPDDYITSNIVRGVSAADFATAMENVRPSVGEKELRQYEEWAKG